MSLAPGYGTPWAGSRTGSDGDSHAPFGGQHHDEESGKLGSGHVGLTHEIESPEIPGRFKFVPGAICEWFRWVTERWVWPNLALVHDDPSHRCHALWENLPDKHAHSNPLDDITDLERCLCGFYFKNLSSFPDQYTGGQLCAAGLMVFDPPGPETPDISTYYWGNLWCDFGGNF
jgi:hypothetical protein